MRSMIKKIRKGKEILATHSWCPHTTFENGFLAVGVF